MILRVAETDIKEMPTLVRVLRFYVDIYLRVYLPPRVQAVVTDDNVQFNALTPGLMVEVTVLSRKPQGLVARLGKLNSYVHITHLRKHVKDYVVDDRVGSTVFRCYFTRVGQRHCIKLYKFV